MHRFKVQILNQQEAVIRGLQNQLDYMNRFIQGRQGSTALDYYQNRITGLEQKIADEQAKLQTLKDNMGVVE